MVSSLFGFIRTVESLHHDSPAAFSGELEFVRNGKSIRKTIEFRNGTQILVDVTELFKDDLAQDERLFYRVVVDLQYDA